MRVVEQSLYIDYRLKLLGIRVSETECQLIARGNGNWESLGPKWPLPVEFPFGPETLKTVSTDTVRLTAWQYDREYPGSDIRTVLAQAKSFAAALADGNHP